MKGPWVEISFHPEGERDIPTSSGSQLCRLDIAPRERHSLLALLFLVKMSWLTTVVTQRVLWNRS